MKTNYVLNLNDHVEEHDEDGWVFTVPFGYKFIDKNEIIHSKRFMTKAEIKEAAKNDIDYCYCDECKNGSDAYAKEWSDWYNRVVREVNTKS